MLRRRLIAWEGSEIALLRREELEQLADFAPDDLSASESEDGLAGWEADILARNQRPQRQD